jgi:glucose-6-phosphate 1-dehydrogenase
VQAEAHLAVGSQVHGYGSREIQLGDFQQFIREHLELMERALYEDDTTIVLLVEDFIERIHAYQAQIAEPERVARLASHFQYWSTFLNAMNPHR